jgi:hypothetical protein
MKPALSSFLFWDCDNNKIDYKKRVNYLSFTFNIPKQEFVCYKKNVYQNLY